MALLLIFPSIQLLGGEGESISQSDFHVIINLKFGAVRIRIMVKTSNELTLHDVLIYFFFFFPHAVDCSMQ